MTHLSREEYAQRYGPTAGDRIRLGDTSLILEIERNDIAIGDEILGGWAKTLRAGIALAYDGASESELDSIVTNVIVVDPVAGIRKTNIGIKDGLIAGFGHAGNPQTGDGLDLKLGP